MRPDLAHRVRPWGIVGVLVAFGGVGCADRQPLVDAYVAAHDERAESFCRCFGPIIGRVDPETMEYTEEQREGCVEASVFNEAQIACIGAVYDNISRSLAEDALACRTAVEHEYGGCLDALACDDLDGFEVCLDEFYAAADACPRLSEADGEDLRGCGRV